MGEILGVWLAAGLTLFMFSFLYKDNPFYRIGENLYVGVTIGYSIVTLYYESWLPKVWYIIHPESGVWFENREWWVLIFPVTLGILVLTRFIPKYAWLSRWTFAFIVGYGSGLSIPATFTTSIQKQAAGTVQPLLTRIPDADSLEEDAVKAEIDSAVAAKKDATSDAARAARVRAEELRERAEAAHATRANALTESQKTEAARSAKEKADKAAEQAAKETPGSDAALAAGVRAAALRNRADAAEAALKVKTALEKADAAEKAAQETAKAAEEAEKKAAGSDEARAAGKKAVTADQAAVAARIAAWDAQSRSEYTLLTFYRDVSAFILFLGVISVLVYFFFSIEHKGPTNFVARIGVYFLMIYFGASYGYTVMGRLSLLYGRLTTLKDACYPRFGFATPILLLVMIGVLAILHVKNKGQEEQA